MSRDSQFKWGLIAATIAACLILLPARGLTVGARSLLLQSGVTMLLIVAGLYYRRRGVQNFVLCINTLLHLVVFTTSFAVMMYALATLGRPLIDQQLVRMDELMGCHLPAMVSWVKRHPTLQRLLEMAYNTLAPQTALVVAVLGLVGDRKPLEVFMRRLMIGAMLTALVFALLPAAGPFEVFALDLTASQQRYMQHLTELRSGQMLEFPLKPEGLITFPSFHTAWAILMALAFWPGRQGRRPPRYRLWLFVPSVILNGAVVVSTMTTGWHYVSDVVGGVIVVVLAMWVAWVLGRWLDKHPSAEL